MANIAETTVGRRYAGWFIKNTERAQKVLDDLKNMPLPPPTKTVSVSPASASVAETKAPTTKPSRGGGPKVAWGGVKVGA